MSKPAGFDNQPSATMVFDRSDRCRCGMFNNRYTATTTVPGAKPVSIALCVTCDTTRDDGPFKHRTRP